MKLWSAKERATVKRLYATTGNREILALLPGRTYSSIRGLAQRMGIVKSTTTRSIIRRTRNSEAPWVDTTAPARLRAYLDGLSTRSISERLYPSTFGKAHRPRLSRFRVGSYSGVYLRHTAGV